MRDSGAPLPKNALLAAVRTRLTHSRYVSPEDFSLRIEKKEDPTDGSVLFPLGTSDESEACVRAARIWADFKKHGLSFAATHYPREIVVGFGWNQDPAFATYTTLVTQLSRPQRKVPAKSALPVLLIVPDAIFRNTLEAWVNSLPGMHCAFLFESIDAALAALPEWTGRAAFAVCDCGFWGQPTRFTELLSGLRKFVPAIPAVITNTSPGLFWPMFASNGYILRRTLPEDALAPIRGAEKKSRDWRDSIRRYNAALWQNAKAGSVCSDDREGGLTQREEEILQALSEGLLNKEIAVRLKISANTVRNHLGHIFQKIGIGTRTEAVAWYLSR